MFRINPSCVHTGIIPSCGQGLAEPPGSQKGKRKDAAANTYPNPYPHLYPMNTYTHTHTTPNPNLYLMPAHTPVHTSPALGCLYSQAYSPSHRHSAATLKLEHAQVAKGRALRGEMQSSLQSSLQLRDQGLIPTAGARQTLRGPLVTGLVLSPSLP